MANELDITFGYHPVVTPTFLRKHRIRKSAGTQHNLVLGRRVVQIITEGLMDCKRLGFRLGAWNVDSLTGRAGEVVEAMSERKHLSLLSNGSVIFL